MDTLGRSRTVILDKTGSNPVTPVRGGGIGAAVYGVAPFVPSGITSPSVPSRFSVGPELRGLPFTTDETSPRRQHLPDAHLSSHAGRSDSVTCTHHRGSSAIERRSEKPEVAGLNPALTSTRTPRLRDHLIPLPRWAGACRLSIDQVPPVGTNSPNAHFAGRAGRSELVISAKRVAAGSSPGASVRRDVAQLVEHQKHRFAQLARTTDMDIESSRHEHVSNL